jgi:hypothetical protein
MPSPTVVSNQRTQLVRNKFEANPLSTQSLTSSRTTDSIRLASVLIDVRGDRAVDAVDAAVGGLPGTAHGHEQVCHFRDGLTLLVRDGDKRIREIP